jgi:ribose transport system ATP-binding protein
MNPPSPPALEFLGVTKRFSGVPVLRDVTFSVPHGHTVGVIGENGAGKSTLMNLLGGNLQPDSGRMLLGGAPHAPQSPAAAAHAGVAFIHQELNLFPNLSIAENLFLTAFPRIAGAPVIDTRKLRTHTAALLATVGLDVAPTARVERLSPGQCQLVEIAKALAGAARLIIFDEPTTSLSARETQTLFALIGRLRNRGIAMIYISHVLGDVLRLCDEVVVLRDGAVAGQGPRSEFTVERMISLMVGRSLSQLYPARAGRPTSEPVLEVRGVSEPHIVRDIRFTLHRGEILGVAGLMGAGRSELARILFGLDRHARGEILVGGESLVGLAPARRIQRGLAFLTEDRRAEGLCLDAAITDNVALVTLREHARTPLRLLGLGRWRDVLRSMRQAVRLNASANDEQPVRTLSGGNQQKVVLAKWLLAKPRVLILDEPTRGIDVGARFDLYQLILQLADGGTGVLLISSEIEELMGICDRLLVMSRGEVRAELPRAQFDRERILQAALPPEESCA